MVKKQTLTYIGSVDTKNTIMIYVTIGVEGTGTPIMHKVSLVVYTQLETPVEVARKFRRKIANYIEQYGWIKASSFEETDLYYDIYDHSDASRPYLTSPNSPNR